MTKKIACALAAMSMVSGLSAQDKDYKNAPFVGVTVGSSRLDRVAHYGNNTSMSDSSSGGYFGILAGYRYFVQPELAIRGYGELEYHPIKIEYDDGNDKDSSYTNFIIGADALYYLKQGDDFDISALAGLGLAISHFDSKMLLESSKSTAGIMFNAGVHVDIEQRHGVDIGFKVFSNKVKDSVSATVGSTSLYVDTTIKQQPAVFVRYTYSF
ncbi:MAG: porin family protein [Helicobacter sp.]|nr:porin family protein [Helicobacter sp.]